MSQSSKASSNDPRQDSTDGPSDIEVALKPLRISKRSEHTIATHGTPMEIRSVSTAPVASSAQNGSSSVPPPAPAAQSSLPVPQTSDLFVCRPMRLSSGSSRHKVTDALPSDPHKGLHLVQTATSSSSSQHDSQPSTPRRNSKQSSHTYLSRRSSVQIKNLPIVHSPRQNNDLDLSKLDDMIFAICLVDFHHVRGPEIQWWRSNYHPLVDSTGHLFRNLPFQALPDGSHLFEETFSNFNLIYDFSTKTSLDDHADMEAFQGNPNHLETLFGCSCVRQVKASDLSDEELLRNKDITRSIVQKSVVVITRKQPIFTKIKEKLSIITHTFFQQANFSNIDLLENLFDNLNGNFKLVEDVNSLKPKLPEEMLDLQNKKNERQDEFFVNLNLHDILSLYRSNMLVILKALLLEKKVLIYSNNNLELLTQFQNNLIALIPDLLNNLELSGCALCDYKEKFSPLSRPSSLKTNDKQSMLRFFGLPLQIFNTKGSFWNPYLPLQQFDELSASTFMVGCSNLLIVNQLGHYKIDVLVNLDTSLVTYPMGKHEELVLSHYDKKFITNLLSYEPTADSYVGSDDHIRYQFEDYIRSLLSTTRFHQYTERFGSSPPGFDIAENKHYGALKDFHEAFITSWLSTNNYKIWDAVCDEFIFNFHEPYHIGAGMSSSSQYNFGSIFSAFKKPPPQKMSLSEKADVYFSHARQPQKYIPKKDENEESELTKLESQSSSKKSWGWFLKT